MNRLPNLDVLRFFLASLVIIFHLPQLCKNQGLPFYNSLEIFHKGIEAVYMFFVLSGFLIIRLIYRSKIENRFSIKKFYMRRILRILPLYYLVLLFGFAFYNIILPELGIPFRINYSIPEGLLWTIFFMPNVFSILHEPGGILEILWSIGVEEQFYVFIAPLLFLIKKKRILLVLILLTFGYFIIFHINVFHELQEYKFVFFFLLFGGIASILEEQNRLDFLKRSSIVSVIIVVLTIVYFITDWFVFEALWIRNLITSILFAFFILAISYNNFGFDIKNRRLNYLGKISYGIYMYHVIALNMVVFIFLKIERFNFFNDLLMIILINILTFALTIVMAHFSYKYFELYFLKQKNKFR